MSEKIKKTNWISTFRLIGKAKIYDNSFKIDEVRFMIIVLRLMKYLRTDGNITI